MGDGEDSVRLMAVVMARMKSNGRRKWSESMIGEA